MQPTPQPRFATITLSPATDCTVRVVGPLALDSVQQAEHETYVPGGKGLNVAKLLAACDLPVLATGLIGHDADAEYAQYCRRNGIEPAFRAVSEPTRVNVMLTDGTHELKLNRPAFPELALRDVWLEEVLERSCSFGATHLIASGSLPARFPVDTYLKIARMAADAGIPIAIDTSGPTLATAMEACPWAIKPNRMEAAELIGHVLADDDACIEAACWLAARAEYAILSDGPRGAWFAHGQEVWHVPSPMATTVDTTGAGDILLAQFCACVATGGYGPEAMCMAVAAGAAATEQFGPQPPPQERIHELVQTIRPLPVN